MIERAHQVGITEQILTGNILYILYIKHWEYWEHSRYTGAITRSMKATLVTHLRIIHI